MEEQTGYVQSELTPACPACGPSADVDIGGWVSAGWTLFVRDIPIAVAIPLIVVIPVIALAMPGYFGMFGMAIISEERSHLPAIVPIAFGALFGMIFLALGVFWPALQGGVYACFLQGIRTGRLTADNLWAGFRRWWACTWVSWLLGGASVLCLPLLFILVGFPLLLGLLTLQWLSLFHIVDKGKGGMEALSFSWRVLRGRLWVMLVYTLLMFTLMNAGVAAFYFGVLVTVPIGDAALAAGYDALSKEQEAAPAAAH